MKKQNVFILVILALVLTTLACSFTVNLPNAVKGNGDTKTEERTVESFDQIDLRGFGNVYVELGDKESLEITAEENLLPYIETYVQGSTLIIEMERGKNILPTESIDFYLTVVELEGIKLSGLADINLPDIESDSFTITISGSGDIDMKGLTADKLDVTLSGLGNLRIDEGRLQDEDILISGSGKFSAAHVEADRVSVQISGLGSATVWATETLDVTISGGGDVEYYGNPDVSQNISGLGDLDHLDD